MRQLGRIGLLGCVGCVLSGVIAAKTLRAQDEDAEAKIDNPLVVQPESPEQRINAALLLLKLARPDLAKEQVDAVVAANLDATSLLALRDTYGTGVFLRLARNADLQPGGSELLEQISAAARTQAGAEGYLDDLIAGFDGNREDAAASLREIKRLGPDAVIALTHRASGDAANDVRLERILSLLGDRAVGPLSDVVLASSRLPERELALRVLARTAQVEQIPTLVSVGANENEPPELRTIARDGLSRLAANGYLFDGSGSLRQFARDMLAGRTRLTRDGVDAVLVYGVQDGAPAEAASMTRLTAAETELRKLIAQRYLTAAVSIDPDDRESLRLLYVLRLETSDTSDAILELSQRGPTASSEVLDLALELGLVRPSVAALDVIGRAGRVDAFANLSPAARALDAPSNEVQFAAARAAVLVGPERSFPNSSRVVEILLQRLAGDTAPKVVVIDPNRRRGGDIGGRLQQIGFEPILAESGREGFRAASSRSDVMLAVVHANSTNWELTPTVANFEADARTASIPVAVVASTQSRDELRWIRSQHPRLIYLPVQADANGVRDALGPALAQLDQAESSSAPDVRREAAALVRQIAERRLMDVFPITETDALENAAFDPDQGIAVDGVTTLGYLANSDAQADLVDVVKTTQDPVVLSAAAEALVRSLARFGSTLSPANLSDLKAAAAGGDLELRQTLALALGLAN